MCYWGMLRLLRSRMRLLYNTWHIFSCLKNMFIKKKKNVCNNKYYFHKNESYVINTDFLLRYFLFLFIALIYFVQEYIPLDLRSRICILSENKLVQ